MPTAATPTRSAWRVKRHAVSAGSVLLVFAGVVMLFISRGILGLFGIGLVIAGLLMGRSLRCSECGNKLADGEVKLCPHCGSYLYDPPPAGATPPAT